MYSWTSWVERRIAPLGISLELPLSMYIVNCLNCITVSSNLLKLVNISQIIHVRSTIQMINEILKRFGSLVSTVYCSTV